MSVDNPIAVNTLKGVGPKIAALLAQLSIVTVQDLLLHLPMRYEDRSRIYRIAGLKPGDRVLIEGNIESLQSMGARRYLKCVMRDVSGSTIDLIFYYFTAGHQKKLAQARGLMRCFGEVRWGYQGHLEMVHPEYALVNQIEPDGLLSLSPGLLPVYPTTKGLSQRVLRKLMRHALLLLQQKKFLIDLLPENVVKKFQFPALNDALSTIHFPPIDADITALSAGKHPAQQRFIVEELIAHQVGLQQLRQRVRSQNAMRLPSATTSKKLLAQLPFQLTAAQTRVIAEIEKDMMQSLPMLRLLQGDVGSGKTIVACFAALNAIEAGHQVALMAPTEILCEQHAKNFLQWLAPLGFSVELLLGCHTTAQQKKIKSRLASGDIQFIIGTHALFQADVDFKQLALLIIDEQHRFGVRQRLALFEKGLKTGYFPHQLMMTATPIPRTLAMTAYTDLDFSVIDELPPNRKPIATALISSEKRDEIIARVRVNAAAQKQAYWICTLIDESELLQCQAAETTMHALQAALPELHIGLVHGRLKSDEKEAVMNAFQRGEIDVLVATTVVEVGVDVANANLMMIENPERLGLAQLHQLRGRVGRGSAASFCVLLYQSPLSEIAQKRLRVMRETQDGFLIAETDLQLRGPGEVLGVRQSGAMSLRIADVMRDQYLLPHAQQLAKILMAEYPGAVSFLVKRWIPEEIKYMHA